MTAEPAPDGPPADYLLRVARSDAGRAYKALASTVLCVGAGDTVIDLGCGVGADLPRFAAAAGRHGRVVGVDIDPAAAAAATAATASLPQVAVVAGDIATVAMADASVDRAYADRVLQHVADPGGVVREARRLLRPGGTAVFAEPDWDTLVIDAADVGASRAYRRFVRERVVRNACVGRQLGRLAAQAGFERITIDPATTVFDEPARAEEILGLQRVAARAVAAGYLTAAAAAAWLGELTRPPFFAAVTIFVVTARVGAPAR